MAEVRGAGSLTACSQGQASGAASEEVVERVVRLLADLGADAGGEAEYGTDGSCRSGGEGRALSLSQGPRPAPGGPAKEKPMRRAVSLAHLR